MDGNIPTNVRISAVVVGRCVDSVAHFHPLVGVETHSAAPPTRPYGLYRLLGRGRMADDDDDDGNRDNDRGGAIHDNAGGRPGTMTGGWQ